MTEQSYVDRFRPETLDEVQGNNSAIEELKDFAENWSEGDSPQLLVGEPGTGKTSTVEAIANEMGYSLNEINASDSRRTADIEQLARSARSTPVDAEHQVVLIDEADSWSGRANKQPLYDVLDDAPNPIFITANDEYEIPDGIKRRSKTHKFKLGVRSRKAKLREIAEEVGLDLDKQDLKSLAERPDLRSAINDLQNWAESDIPPGEGGREWESSEFSAVKNLLKAEEGWEEEMKPGDMVLWADENLSQEYRGVEAMVAYDTLSRADMRLGQSYNVDNRLMRYTATLCSLLSSLRLSEPYDGYIDVSFPEWFRASKTTFQDATAEAELYRELKGEWGYSFAGSYYEFREEYLPILKNLSDDEKKELVLDEGLSKDCISALGMSKAEFEDYKVIEEASEGDGWEPDTQSAADW